MNAITKIANSNLENYFTQFDGSTVLAPVVSRPLQGVGRDGSILPVHGFKANYRTDSDGKPVFLGTVGEGYEIVQFRDLVREAQSALSTILTPEQLRSIKVKDRSAFGGAWVERAYTIEAFEGALTYAGRKGREVGTAVACELRLRTGYDGNTRTALSAGTLDLWCTNGAVALNELDAISRKHTKAATVDIFRDWFAGAIDSFGARVDTFRTWAQTEVEWSKVETTVKALPGVSEQRALKLLARIEAEVRDRGLNAYAVSSAFTYYSSHNSSEFPVRKTGNDNVETTLADRQVEVQRWLSSPQWRELLAA